MLGKLDQLLISLIILLVIAGGGYYAAKNGYFKKFAKQDKTIETTKTADWKTYSDNNWGIEFHYPSQYGDINVYEPAYKDFISMTAGALELDGVTLKDNFTFYAEHTVSLINPSMKYCLQGLCNLPAKSTLTYNNLEWVMPDTSVSTGGGTDAPTFTNSTKIYRTSKNGIIYYLGFSSEEVANKILSTFKFLK